MKIANTPICFFIVTEAAITHHTHFVLSFLHLALNNLFPIHQPPIITLLWNHFLKAWKQSDYIELISVQNVSLENQFVNISIITITKDRILFSVIVHRHIKKANISATKAFISLINRTLMVRIWKVIILCLQYQLTHRVKWIKIMYVYVFLPLYQKFELFNI